MIVVSFLRVVYGSLYHKRARIKVQSISPRRKKHGTELQDYFVGKHTRSKVYETILHARGGGTEWAEGMSAGGLGPTWSLELDGNVDLPDPVS